MSKSKNSSSSRIKKVKIIKARHEGSWVSRNIGKEIEIIDEIVETRGLPPRYYLVESLHSEMKCFVFPEEITDLFE